MFTRCSPRRSWPSAALHVVPLHSVALHSPPSRSLALLCPPPSSRSSPAACGPPCPMASASLLPSLSHSSMVLHVALRRRSIFLDHFGCATWSTIEECERE